MDMIRRLLVLEWLRALWVPLAAIAVALIPLVFLIPAIQGYEGPPRSLAEMLWGFWNFRGDWEHCMLVPFIVAYLVWHKRGELLATSWRGSAIGSVPLLIGALLFWLGDQADVPYFGFAAIHVWLIGLVLWFIGGNGLRLLLFPLSFLVFMWPLLPLDNMIAFPLRIVMSGASHHLLNFLGQENLRIGSSVVSAPVFGPGGELIVQQGSRFALDVADPCSGIRSLFALMMVSALYAYFAVFPWKGKKSESSLIVHWPQWVVFMAAAPLAVAGNMARILILTFGTIAFGAPFAIGTLTHPTWFHEMAGYAVFAVALGGMMGLGWCLNSLPQWIKVCTRKIEVTDEESHRNPPPEQRDGSAGW
jgi:exosortase